jgi:folate-binding protein YgfZ
LTPQGRLLCDLLLVGGAEGCRLDVPLAQREATLQRLSMYRLRAKVALALDEAPVWALFGTASERVPEGGVRDPRRPELGWRIYGDAAPADAIQGEEADYDAWRLGLGVPASSDWAGETTYPIEANFDLLAGIDFKKGCFIGQETTSRMKRRGQIKTRMLPISFEGPAPAPGSEVLAGELRAGEVRSGGPGRAMALLRLDRIAGALSVDGRPVTVERPAWMAAALD